MKYLIISFILALTGCHAINQKFGMDDDNAIEEIAEDVLKAKTGIDLDFTPDSPEK